MASRRKLNVDGAVVFFNDQEIGVMLRGAQGEVAKDVQRRSYAVQKRMKRAAPKWKGRLRSGIKIESEPKAPDGPASRVVSTAPHTLVIEFGRGPVTASGAVAGQLRTRSKARLSKSSLQWGSDRARGAPKHLEITFRNGVKWYRPSVRGTKKGAGFMANSIDAAID